MDKDKILGFVNAYVKGRNKPKQFVPTVDEVPVSGTTFSALDITQLVNVAMDGWVTEGQYAKAFASKLAKFTGIPRVTLCNSGSSANLLAVTALVDLYSTPKNSLIVTSALAFPTTVAPIMQNGMIPYFIDIDLQTLNPNTDNLVELANNPKVGGIILAHTLGFPYDEKAVVEAFGEAGKWVVADSCDALGALLKDNLHVGKYADAATFSFFPAHHISAGEGGAVACHHTKLQELIHQYSNWGRSCFPAKTLIRTNSGAKFIEDVSVGDIVINHLGEKDTVTETMNRVYSGDVYTIKARTIPRISVTSEHPFFVYNKETDIYEWVSANKLSAEKHLLLEHKGNTSVIDKEIGRAVEYEYSTVNNLKSFVLQLNGEVLRLMGYYLSQGSLASGLKGKSGYSENKYLFYRTDFAFNSEKVDIIQDLCYLMKKYFDVSPSYRIKYGATTTCFKSRKAFEFFSQTCGRISYKKKISEFILSFSNPDDLLQLVSGYMLGDGNRNWQGCAIFSTSPELFSQLRSILVSHGIVGSCTIRTKEKHHSSIVNGKKIEQKHNLYNLAIYGKYAEKFMSSVGIGEFSSKTQRTFVRDLGDYFGYTINSISVEKEKELPVYNLEVEKEHSYHAGFVAVHNCNCSPGEDNKCGNRFGHEYPHLPFGYDHKYVFDKIGYNLKITDLQAALGSSQMDRVHEMVMKRKSNYAYLMMKLREIPLFDNYFYTVKVPVGFSSSPFGFPITIKNNKVNRLELVKFLDDRKIRTRPIFSGNITRHPMMQHVNYMSDGALNNCDYVMNNSIWLGTHPELIKEQLDYVILSFEEFLRA